MNTETRQFFESILIGDETVKDARYWYENPYPGRDIRTSIQKDIEWLLQNSDFDAEFRSKVDAYEIAEAIYCHISFGDPLLKEVA
jgi:hypothetical protein